MKFLLDTCVISDLNRPQFRDLLMRRLNKPGESDQLLSVLSLGEISRGAALLPEGSRRRSVEVWIQGIEEAFAERMLPIDREIAVQWGRISASLRQRGVILPDVDGLIAATAIVHQMVVVTRNVKHFSAFEIPVYNPWEEENPRF